MVRICLHGNQWYSEREGGLCHLPVHALDHVQCKDRDKLTMVGDMWNGRPVRNMLQVILTLNCYEYNRYMEVTVPVVMCVC